MKKSMKKVLGVVLSLTLMMAMSISVFAAGSATATGTVTKVTVTTASGRTVEVKMAASTEKISIDTVKELLAGKFVEGMSVVDIKDITIDGLTDADFPLTLTFAVPNVTRSSNVAVLHKVKGVWKSETATAGDGVITVTGIESLSPFAIISDAKPAAGTKGGKVSPKTGETALPIALGFVAVLAIGGACVSFRKKAEVR